MTQATITLRKSKDRGHAQHGWLNSYHTFSFAGYQDPEYMGFRTLRVINDDTVEAAKGFDTHQHRDMEIISYIIEGALEHKDSMGNGSVIKAGQVQRITAGSGISHSEFNHSKSLPVHFLQIWILPAERGLEPSYQEIDTQNIKAQDGLKLICSPDGTQQSILIHQDAKVFLGELEAGQEISYTTLEERGIWIQVIEGSLQALDQSAGAGDGLAIENTTTINIKATAPTKFLLFDLK